MKAMTISQLLQLTKREILEIRRNLRAVLPQLPFGSIEHYAAQQTLTNIETVLLRPEFQPGLNRFAGPAP